MILPWLNKVLCMYVCIYVCMYVCMYVYMYVCMYVCTYVRTYIHTYIQRFKDCVKDSLALCKIDDPDWEMVACDRNRWRKMVYSGSRCFQDNANIWAKTKRAARKGDNIDPDLSQFVCKECGRVCLSSAGLTSHRRSQLWSIPWHQSVGMWSVRKSVQKSIWPSKTP